MFNKNFLIVFIVCCFLGLFAFSGNASPFLVYSPQNLSVDKYELEINGESEMVIPVLTETGGSKLVHDLENTPPGTYNVRARARGEWWPLTSWSEVFTFIVPDVGTPINGGEITNNP